MIIVAACSSEGVGLSMMGEGEGGREIPGEMQSKEVTQSLFKYEIYYIAGYFHGVLMFIIFMVNLQVIKSSPPPPPPNL